VTTDATPEGFPPDSPYVNEVAPSPNFGERTNYSRPDCLILHYTGMPTAEGAILLLRDPKSQVSCHYVVEESGRIVQLVPEAKRAWHAGLSIWRGVTDMNSASIGIEICNAGHDAGLPEFPLHQIQAVIALCKDIGARNAIRPERILAHSDIAPGRKRDPGERFPWDALARAGVGLWVDPLPPSPSDLYSRGLEGPNVRGLQTLLSLFGYGIEASGVYDARTEIVVAAFQRHFRPARVDGLADASTLAVLRALVALLEAPDG
jgi:N-acetylmuramoyl-L-alanine amidase